MNATIVAVGMAVAFVLGGVFGFACGWVICARQHGDEVAIRPVTASEIVTVPGWQIDGRRLRWGEIHYYDRPRAVWVGEDTD